MIQQLREQLIDDLTAGGVTVHESFHRFNPPGVLLVTPRSGSYVTAGQFPGSFEVAIDLIVVVKAGEVSAEYDALDQMIEAILTNTVDWAFRGADAPTLANINGADYPGTIIHLAKQGKLY